ncbi:hypothetical protein J2X46_004455 [Nocardioides sp. BE266]|uniref:hypothetical protein n=1 Tax=Nocardioides sp. BE266 TaxID=2817725 RepID=UPI00285CE830|nr:hypothetical protein [Nocardioides sp. BE266]MDR7255448.1 hypothetical protein [Nocardioides sp. BE266]
MRRILAVAVLALSALIGLPTTSDAGGPTSVLVTKVGAGAGGLYYSDQAYDAIVRLLPDGATVGEAEPPGYDGDNYNLTWMIHDVTPWRWDRIHIDPDGTAWVSTTVTQDAIGQWQELGPADRLVGLLNGVVQQDGGPAIVNVPGEPLATQAASQPATPAPADDASWISLSGWRWVVPGALLGLLAGVAAGHRSRDEEPRRVLISS